MEYTFVPMTEGYAKAIVEQWKYSGEYSIYDYSNEVDHILDPSAWGVGLFAILNEREELVGELSIEFYDDTNHYTEYEQFKDNALINQREMWIGFGLKPDLVSHGLGSHFVEACVGYAIDHTKYRGEYVRLGVATFNQRAIKVYKRAGFQIYDQTIGKIAGVEHACLYMKKRINDE